MHVMALYLLLLWKYMRKNIKKYGENIDKIKVSKLLFY